MKCPPAVNSGPGAKEIPSARANVAHPGHPRVVLAMARTNHAMENYGLVRDLYAQLQEMDAALAERFAYLDLRGAEATRAAEVTGLGG